MNRTITLHSIAALAATACLLWYASADNRQMVESVKTGQVALWCEFTDGARQVEASKVVDYLDERSAWIFTNGSASNCEIRG